MATSPFQLFSPALLLGVADAELIFLDEFNCELHPAVVTPLRELAAAARKEGFSLQVASSYRTFARQLLIWNNKAYGLRPVLDQFGQPIDINSLSDKEKVFAILRWSALPGASRHHWGADLDVYDVSNITADYNLQLTVEETQGDGPFTEFHQWLSQELQKNPRGFYRPYVAGVGGIAPEPWHLSYAPVAKPLSMQLTEALLCEQIQISDIALKNTILENLGDIYAQYVAPYRA